MKESEKDQLPSNKEKADPYNQPTGDSRPHSAHERPKRNLVQMVSEAQQEATKQRVIQSQLEDSDVFDENLFLRTGRAKPPTPPLNTIDPEEPLDTKREDLRLRQTLAKKDGDFTSQVSLSKTGIGYQNPMAASINRRGYVPGTDVSAQDIDRAISVLRRLSELYSPKIVEADLELGRDELYVLNGMQACNELGRGSALTVWAKLLRTLSDAEIDRAIYRCGGTDDKFFPSPIGFMKMAVIAFDIGTVWTSMLNSISRMKAGVEPNWMNIALHATAKEVDYKVQARDYNDYQDRWFKESYIANYLRMRQGDLVSVQIDYEIGQKPFVEQKERLSKEQISKSKQCLSNMLELIKKGIENDLKDAREHEGDAQRIREILFGESPDKADSEASKGSSSAKSLKAEAKVEKQASRVIETGSKERILSKRRKSVEAENKEDGDPFI